jgi:release factor glutamine methyltransferase
MTLLEVLQSSTDYLKKRQIAEARLNAEHLLAFSLGKKRLDLYLEFDRQLTEPELVPLRELIRRRGQGEPLQHLLGTAEFCGRNFICDKRAMVPRPETEELAEILIADCRSRNADLKILDVGTGSGVIALSMAVELPQAKVYATDISPEALSLARENAEKLELTGRVQFREADLLEGFDERFDVIAANLPYIAMSERPSLSREVLHDPAVALFGGEGGDEIIGRLIEQAPLRLQPNGLLALEIGVGRGEALAALLAQKNFHDIEAKNDYSGVGRFLLARYG